MLAEWLKVMDEQEHTKKNIAHVLLCGHLRIATYTPFSIRRRGILHDLARFVMFSLFGSSRPWLCLLSYTHFHENIA